MKASKYQQAIYNWIKTGKGNAIVQAVAGSGKTTTIVNATQIIPSNKSSIFVAFNKAIANELKIRLPEHIRVSTLHALGLSMFQENTNTRPKVVFNKLDTIIKKILYSHDIDDTEDRYWEYLKFLKKLVPLLKATLVDYKKYGEVVDICLRYGIVDDVTEEQLTLIKQVMERCRATIEIIDFDDMIWIPIINNFKVQTFDWVLVDESQDLNRVQFELITKICNDNTRVIAVGDRSQAIYSFRGADTASMDNFKTHFQAQEFPLSICYRCSKKVAELAKEIVDQIEVSSTAIVGKVEETNVDYLLDKAEDGDMVLCRTNAPLVKVAFALIRGGKKAVIRGRDIGKNLITMINKYKAMNLQDLMDKISRFQRLQEEKIILVENGEMDIRRKSTLMALIDQCETVITIADNVETIEQLKSKIQEIFTDDKVGIICSSIHKAKGLEADNIFIINWDKMPHPMAKTDEEIEQEYNIKYVAITRAKSNLYIIPEV